METERQLSNLFAGATIVAGVGILVLQVAGGYGAGPAVDYGSPTRFVLPVFVGVWVLHVFAYFVSRNVQTGSGFSLVYVVGQLGLVVGLTVSSGRALAALVLYVVWGAQVVAMYPRRWPMAVVAGGTVALIAMSRNPTATQEIITIVTILSLIVMATYLVSHVRGVLVRKEAKELLDELSSTQVELTGYAAQVEEVALLNERQRMARELHDTLAQGLVGVTLQLEAADSQLEKGGARRAREIVNEAMARARETLTSVRNAIHDLRENQDIGGLEQLIRNEASRFSNATGIPCVVDVRMEKEPTAEIVQVVKSVVAEGLTNIAKHSQAKTTAVVFQSCDSDVEVTVTDDGIGFDTNTDLSNGHYGLLGLRERARQVGGTLNVESQKGRGVCVTFLWVNGANGDGPESPDKNG